MSIGFFSKEVTGLISSWIGILENIAMNYCMKMKDTILYKSHPKVKNFMKMVSFGLKKKPS